MTYVISQKSSVEVITLEELKSFLRVSFNDDDILLKSLLSSAVSMAEKYMNNNILTTTWENFRPTYIDDLTLRRGPFQSVESIEVLVNGVYTVIPTTDYIVSIGGTFGVICELTVNETVDDNCNAVKITFKSGFGDTGSDIPEDIKIAIMTIVGWLYESRGDCGGCSDDMPITAKTILKNYRIIDLIGDSPIVCV